MTNASHMPGPWHAVNGKPRKVVSENGNLICNAVLRNLGRANSAKNLKDEKEAEANAARIVACVNACEGLADPSVVPDLLAALEGIELKSAGSICDSGRPDINEIARAAIAKAKGGGGMTKLETRALYAIFLLAPVIYIWLMPQGV